MDFHCKLFMPVAASRGRGRSLSAAVCDVSPLTLEEDDSDNFNRFLLSPFLFILFNINTTLSAHYSPPPGTCNMLPASMDRSADQYYKMCVCVRLGRYPYFHIVILSGIPSIAHKMALEMQEKPIGPLLPEC